MTGNGTKTIAGAAPTILVIDDDAEIRYSLHRVLSSRSFRALTASSGKEGIRAAEKETPEVIFLDNRMEGMSGMETLQHLRNCSPKSMVILMTAFGTTQTAIEAMKFGAFDYIIKPFDVKKVLSLTENAIRAHRDLAAAQGNYSPLLNSDDYKEGIVGVSDKMQSVFKTIGQVAANDFTVLITGESGTGKELVARCIHQHSHLSEGAFMAVNCAAIPDNLIESELFGHERGAFTGAANQRIGIFEQCDGGTIFLDEIGDMALATQTKILRALQEGEIQRVGGTGVIKVKVRLIAATNKDLEKMVEEKTFREDLYYRLNVVRIKLPALRDRMEDVPPLIDFMLQRMGKGRRSKVKQVSPEALNVLMQYRWPGNVRELENVIQRCSIVAKGETILEKDLPPEVQAAVANRSTGEVRKELAEIAPEILPVRSERVQAPAPAPFPEAAPSRAPTASPQPLPPEPNTVTGTPAAISLEDAFDILYDRIRKEEDEAILEVIERAMIVRALKETGGNQVKTSNLLGITRATLRKRIDQFKLRY